MPEKCIQIRRNLGYLVRHLSRGVQIIPLRGWTTGIDIASKTSDPITPFMEGTVVYAGEISWGYGRHVIADHGNHVRSVYAHLSSINTSEGKDVKPGDILGKQGSTGWSTGPHLHFQINVFGIPVNPRKFLP